MKRKHAWQSAAALAVSLILLLSTSAALAAELENGVTWETTIDDMRTIEGIPEGEEREGSAVGDYLQHGFLHFADGPYVRFMLYIFKSEQLAMYGASLSEYFQVEGTQAADIYAEYLQQLTQTYGETTITDTARCLAAFNTMEEGSLLETDIVAYAGWDLEDGTALHLVELQNEYDHAVMYLYVNETRLLSE